MISSGNTILLAITALASHAAAVVQMEVRYSDNMIDVGNLDIFANTWQTLYSTPGNQRAVLTDKSIGADNNPCTAKGDSDPTVTVTIKMDGAWGQTPGLAPNQMREGLIQSMWEVLKNIAAHNEYDVFGGCTGFTWQEGTPGSPTAACGGRSGKSCENACKDASDIASQVECSIVTQGHKVPSEMRVSAYINNQLQPDSLLITFNSAQTPVGGGCGVEGVVAKAVAGFVPVV